MCVGIGGSLSNLLAEHSSYEASFSLLATLGFLALPFFCVAMPETAVVNHEHVKRG